MKEKTVLVSPTCPGCDQIKEHLTRLGVLNRYKVITVIKHWEGKGARKT